MLRALTEQILVQPSQRGDLGPGFVAQAELRRRIALAGCIDGGAEEVDLGLGLANMTRRGLSTSTAPISVFG